MFLQNHNHFKFTRDTFAFANELLWEYQPDPQTGAMRMARKSKPPAYHLHCFVLVRSARQFYFHTRFNPDLAALTAEGYRALIRQVVKRNPRHPSVDAKKITIPGYSCLRAFSQAQEQSLKQSCGGAWESYVLRSHWRMVFPFSRTHQARSAEALLVAVKNSLAPVVHIVRFPQLTINHGLLLFEVEESNEQLVFSAYDPNLPQSPSFLTYRRADRTFYLPANCYWAGGRVDTFQIYRGGLY